MARKKTRVKEWKRQRSGVLQAHADVDAEKGEAEGGGRQDARACSSGCTTSRGELQAVVTAVRRCGTVGLIWKEVLIPVGPSLAASRSTHRLRSSLLALS